ncbi:MAG: CerR family C-terminal domain-containing protein [Planctomycetota bacterium]
MRTEDANAKQRLMDAALKLFADRGPDHVSVRDIAAEAGVTHGSIRYHFGTKKKLYGEVVRRLGSIDEHVENMPAIDEIKRLARDDAEEMFRAVIHRFVRFQAKMGEDSVAAHRMLQAEISRDGGPDPVFYKKVIKPGHDHMKAIISGIRPEIRDDETLEILAFNVIFQCVMVRIGQGIIKKLLGTRRLREDSVTRIAELIADVSLAGIENADI